MTANLKLRFKRELEKGKKRGKATPSDSIHHDCNWTILSLILLMCDTPNILYSLSIISLWKKKHTLCEEKNAKLSNRNFQYISVVMPPSFRGKAELETRTCPSTFKNMPFLRQEGRLLRARRAYTRMQNVTYWFLVGYILGCRWWYMRVVRMVSLVGCKDFFRFNRGVAGST